MSLSKGSVIIGIDPGTRITGYGILRLVPGGYQVLDYGSIKPPESLKLSDRYLIIFNAIEELLARFQPNMLVVETQFVKNNIQSAIKLGMARGIAIIAAKKRGLSIYEYPPSKAKLAVVGNGHASKFQVRQMVQRLLHLATPPPEDAADALALALCLAHAIDQINHTATEI